jgi:type IV secretion system protein VirB4
MRTYIIRPHDLAHSTETLIGSSYSNLTNSFRQIADDGWTVYVDSFRNSLPVYPVFHHESAPDITVHFEHSRARLYPLFETVLYITLCFSIAEKNSAIKQLLFRNSELTKDNILYDLAQFKSVTDDFENMLRSTFKGVICATSDQQLTYFHSTLSDTSHPVITPEVPFYLDYYLADGLFVPDSVCKYNDTYIVCATIHDFPSITHAGMATRIMSIPVEFRLCSRFTFIGVEAAKKEIKNIRKVHFQKRRGAGAMFQEAIIKQPTVLEDTEATSQAADAGAALARMSSGNLFYGRLATTLIVYDKSYDNAIRKLDFIKKVVNDLGFICKTETINTPAAFLGSIPGNHKYNARQPTISTENFAHFFTLSVPWNGNYTNTHLHTVLETSGYDGCGDAPHILCKCDNSPFFLNLNYGDVGHTLIIGPTGAGKSTLLSTLCVQWLKYPSTRVIFFDKDASSFNATKASGGIFVEVNDSTESLKLNPFSDLSSIEEMVFVTQLITNHFIHRGVTLRPMDQKEMYDSIVAFSAVEPELRDWGAFQGHVQDKDLRVVLQPFVDGEYSHLFKRGPDEIQRTRWLTFELGELMKKGKSIVSFVLECLFHRISFFLDGSPTLIVVDEAWVFLDNPIFASQLRDYLKTLRKRNCYILLATQEMQDARGSAIFSTILNDCMTKILLPNHQAWQPENAALYKDLGLTEGDITALSKSIPKRDYFFFSPEGKQTFSLNLGPEELSLIRPRSLTKEVSA